MKSNILAAVSGVVTATLVFGLPRAAQCQSETVLHTFTGISPDGGGPSAGLMQDWQGTLYGTAGNTAFGMTPDGQYYWTGAIPRGNWGGALIQGSDGQFYGMTHLGGGSNRGEIFSVQPDLQVSYLILHEFSGPDGSYPFGALLEASDGNFYSTTSSGGMFGRGTAFRMTPDGTFTTLYSFSGADGDSPYGTLIQASDGMLYGTTAFGGMGGTMGGTVFRMTLDGTVTIMHAFSASGPDGNWLNAGLLQASDGHLYGLTSRGGGSLDRGTVFRMSLDGTFTVVHTLSVADGIDAYGELIEGPDGALYGTQSDGGAWGHGTIFRVLPTTGDYTVLYDFRCDSTCPSGANPRGPLVLGLLDGALYGTTEFGGLGPSAAGVVFRFVEP